MTTSSTVERTEALPVGPDSAPAADGSINVGDAIVATNTRWSFGGSTHEHFDAHVNRSIPLYLEGHALIDQVVEFFSRPGASIIDVGCSTGTLLERLAAKPTSAEVSLIGYDIEADMVRASRARCVSLDNVTVRQGNAETIDYVGAGAVIMYYTLQFAEPSRRRAIIQRIADSLEPGSALILFEKVLSTDAKSQDIIGQLYHEFKSNSGFDPSEIYNKARSLRSVMAPVSSEQNHEDLRASGFSSVVTIQKYLCFEGILAIK